MFKFKLFVIAVLLLCTCTFADKKAKKYSREANDPQFEQVKSETYDPDFRTLQRPFRMAKLNLVWAKAQNVSKIFLFNISRIPLK